MKRTSLTKKEGTKGRACNRVGAEKGTWRMKKVTQGEWLVTQKRGRGAQETKYDQWL